MKGKSMNYQRIWSLRSNTAWRTGYNFLVVLCSSVHRHDELSPRSFLQSSRVLATNLTLCFVFLSLETSPINLAKYDFMQFRLKSMQKPFSLTFNWHVKEKFTIPYLTLAKTSLSCHLEELLSSLGVSKRLYRMSITWAIIWLFHIFSSWSHSQSNH